MNYGFKLTKEEIQKHVEKYLGKKSKYTGNFKFKDRGRAFEIRCECGAITYQPLSRIKQGRKCKKCNLPWGKNHPLFSGLEELSGSKFYRIKSHCLRGKDRILKFNLNIRYIWELYLAQNRKCIFTGLELNFENKIRKDSNYIEGNASLDRIDSSKGYVKGNVQWVHKSVNIMKQDMPDAEFIKWCDLISQHAKKNSRLKIAA